MGTVLNSMGLGGTQAQQAQINIQQQQPNLQTNMQQQQASISAQSLLGTIRSFDFGSMARLETLISRESSLNTEEREEMQRLLNQLSTVLAVLTPQVNMLANNQAQRPLVSGISVHVHATPGELEHLPERLATFQSQINIQQQQQRVRHLGTNNLNPQQFGGATITIVADQQIPFPVIQHIHRQQQQQLTVSANCFQYC